MTETVYLGVREAAELLKVKTGTIYQWVWQRRIPYYKLGGKKLMFNRDELLGMIEMNRHADQSELEAIAATSEMKRRANK